MENFGSRSMNVWMSLFWLLIIFLPASPSLLGYREATSTTKSGELIFYSLIDERNGNVYLVSRKRGIEFPGGEYRS